MARDLTAMGTPRTESAVRAELSRLELSLPDLRTDLSVEMVCDLVGRSRPTVLGALTRRELKGRKADGAWRVWPSEVRRWVLADPSVVVPAAVESWDELVGLLGGLWGVPNE